MISGAQLFVAVWLGCACVYAVPVWATLSLSKARRACGAYADFDHVIEMVEKRGLLPLGALLACLLFPLSLAYDVVVIRAKLDELEQTKKYIESLKKELDETAAGVAEDPRCGFVEGDSVCRLPPNHGGLHDCRSQVEISLPPLPPGHKWAKCEACGTMTVQKEG